MPYVFDKPAAEVSSSTGFTDVAGGESLPVVEATLGGGQRHTVIVQGDGDAEGDVEIAIRLGTTDPEVDDLVPVDSLVYTRTNDGPSVQVPMPEDGKFTIPAAVAAEPFTFTLLLANLVYEDDQTKLIVEVSNKDEAVDAPATGIAVRIVSEDVRY